MESVLKSPGTVTWLTVEMDDSIHSFIHIQTFSLRKRKKYNVRAICLLTKTNALRQGAKNSIFRNCRGT